MAVAVVAWLAAAVMMAVPVVAADGRPTLEVTPTRSLHLADLAPGETQTGQLLVLNQSARPARVRLLLPAQLSELPRRVAVTIARDDIVVWTGSVRGLTQQPVLPGRLEPGASWELDVRATAAGQAPADLEVLGEQASRDDQERAGEPMALPPAPIDTGDTGVALSAEALDPRGHEIPLRVQLVSYSLLVLGLLWLVVAFRRDGGTGRGRRPSADHGR